jgi:DNA-directed RNA polymerase specialized sigma24 family protein
MPKTFPEDKISSGNRVSEDSIKIIETIISSDKCKTKREAHEVFLLASDQYVSYITFLKHWEKLTGETNKRQKYPGSLKNIVKSFIENVPAKTIKHSWQMFVEDYYDISYTYYLMIVKEMGLEVQEKIVKRGRPTRPVRIPLTVEDIFDSWDDFIMKTISKLLDKRGFRGSKTDKIQEVRQEVYVTLCKYYDASKYSEEKAKFVTYLYNIVRNCFYHIERKESTNPLNHSVSLDRQVEAESDTTFLDLLSVDDIAANKYQISYTSSVNSIEDNVNISTMIQDFQVYLNQVDTNDFGGTGKNGIISTTNGSGLIRSTVSLNHLYLNLEAGNTMREISSNLSISTAEMSKRRKKMEEEFITFTNQGTVDVRD